MRRVAIAGGGGSGTLLAVHLLRLARRPLEVVVVDPVERLGRGRAYADGPAVHLLNVRAARLSVALESGRALEADRLALAPGNPPSSPPLRWLSESGLAARAPPSASTHRASSTRPGPDTFSLIPS